METHGRVGFPSQKGEHRILQLFVQDKKRLVPWAIVENPETWPVFWVYVSWKVIIEKQSKIVSYGLDRALPRLDRQFGHYPKDILWHLVLIIGWGRMRWGVHVTGTALTNSDKCSRFMALCNMREGAEQSPWFLSRLGVVIVSC